MVFFAFRLLMFLLCLATLHTFALGCYIVYRPLQTVVPFLVTNQHGEIKRATQKDGPKKSRYKFIYPFMNIFINLQLLNTLLYYIFYS